MNAENRTHRSRTPALRGRNRPSHPRRLAALERTKRALALRLAGHTIAAIARQLGCAASTAYEALQRGMIDFRADVERGADDLRTLEVARLDYLLTVLEKRLRAGDCKAIDRAIRIGERRAALLGLDAPRKIAPTMADGAREWRSSPGPDDRQRTARLEELLATAASRRTRGAPSAMPVK